LKFGVWIYNVNNGQHNMNDNDEYLEQKAHQKMMRWMEAVGWATSQTQDPLEICMIIEEEDNEIINDFNND